MSLQELDNEEGYQKDTRPGKEYLESKPYDEASRLLQSELKKFGFDDTKQQKFPYGSSAPPVLGSFKYTVDYFNDQYKVKRWKAPTGNKPAFSGGGTKFKATQYSPTNVMCCTVDDFNITVKDIPAISGERHWQIINSHVFHRINDDGKMTEIPYISAALMEKVK